MVKYLGVRANIDAKLQRRTARELIYRNLNSLKWKMKDAEPDVVQQVTCCLTRSLLIYIGTPMVTAGLWKRKDIDSLEASFYRKIMLLSNSISNKAILNTMTSIRLEGEAIENLVKRKRDDAERQKRITSFYDGKPEGKAEGKPEGEPERSHWGKNLGPGPGKSAQCQEFPFNGYSPGCSQP
jgi:hypothetical protein